MAAAAEVLKEQARKALRAFPVICDDGQKAAVVVLYLPSPPRCGWQFAAMGKLWQVAREASFTRGAVAHPLPEGRDPIK